LRDWSSSLETLEVKFPDIDAEPLEIFTKSLADLKNVKSLKLEFTEGAPVTQGFIEGLAKGLKALAALEVLHLEMRECELDNSNIEALIEEIKEKIYLKDLKLSFGKNAGVGRKGTSNLFIALKELKELETLNLNMEGCGIDNNNIDPLASSIERLAKLKKLKLCLHVKEFENTQWDKRSMIELDVSRLSASFSELPNLSTLKLNLLNIKMTDKDRTNLVENMKKMGSLQKLVLFFNGNDKVQDIGSLGTMKKFSGLISIPMLRDLSLNIIRPSEEDLWDLFYYLESMKKLRALRVGFYEQEVCFNEAIERYKGMMRSLGSQLKSFEMAFYRCNSLESDFTTDFLRGLEQLKQAENVRVEMVQTEFRYYDWETHERVVEKMVNMKTLRRFHYAGNQII